ncbi:XRE family transcriptional regulator [Pseudoclavibacter endophyticus]|uniref:Helix-turn-helix domain-containing protein n=1 Tax=Pseudoclavibacter endophyticus TaxID=1778590 RepID=A0A6H9WN92_9MICO|nr:XRE family transcriptional regulator [Pseudoclavibacter endophyticus]KAB1648228.1 helix-turn-helix domain-containing protein [Pseudoclavibacter endophyticus]GGA70829.1 XRE family transcriptional regulator [Pseudoclavibacter endophyticus]
MSSAHSATLAENLRRLRETRGLSLSQLSDRSGIAKATLFKIERGHANPTLDTLVAIADTFDVQVTSLIASSPRAVIDVVRDGEGVEDISDDASVGFVLRRMVVGAGSIEIHSQRFQPDAVETSPSHGSGAREHVLVRSGRIEAGPVGLEVDLGPGDYATYPADRTHRWRAIDQEAAVFIVHTFPRAATVVE